MASILITGTSRGLGLELIRQFLSLPTAKVATIFATTRSSEPSAALSKVIDASNGRVRFASLDVSNDSSVLEAARTVTSQLGDNGLDILINNVGIQLIEGATSQLKITDLENSFSTNVSSVHRVSTAFLPLLNNGKEKKIVNVTSTLGSIGMIRNFAMSPTPSYKISKAALNMLTAQYAMELGPKGFTVFAISPGWLRTELGGSYADLDPEVGAKEVVRIVMEATSEKDNGAFRDIKVEGHANYPGANPPW